MHRSFKELVLMFDRTTHYLLLTVSTRKKACYKVSYFAHYLYTDSSS